MSLSILNENKKILVLMLLIGVMLATTNAFASSSTAYLSSSEWSDTGSAIDASSSGYIFVEGVNYGDGKSSTTANMYANVVDNIKFWPDTVSYQLGVSDGRSASKTLYLEGGNNYYPEAEKVPLVDTAPNQTSGYAKIKN